MSRVKYIAIILAVAGLLSLTAADKCDTVNLYKCPLCGGIMVSSCLECDGYLNAGGLTSS